MRETISLAGPEAPPLFVKQRKDVNNVIVDAWSVEMESLLDDLYTWYTKDFLQFLSRGRRDCKHSHEFPPVQLLDLADPLLALSEG